MATNGHAPVMVEQKAGAPALDLPTDSQPTPVYEETSHSRDASVTRTEEEDEHDETWESASIYEEILDDVEEFEYATGPDVFTATEAKAYRDRLREVGPGEFIFETVTSGKVTAKKLCSAFGAKIPKFLDGLRDNAYYQLLGHAIARYLAKRQRLSQYRTIDDAARLLEKSQNIMVITGAGISTSLGIPDFRSKNTGFYSKLQEMGYSEPEQVFDIHNFDEDPSTFYNLAGDILPDLERWSPTHEFIRLLQDKGKLLTNYTQNIDNVESHAGINPEKLVQCHGSWATATCRKCQHKIPGEQIFDDIKAQRISECPQCLQVIKSAKPGMKRKRSSNSTSKSRKRQSSDDSDSDGAYDIPQAGVMKPDITFFGEQLPDHFFVRLRERDQNQVDLLIVIGTSMKVAPVSEVPHVLPSDVPQIYISRDPIHHIDFDMNLLGDCDTVVAELCKRAGWDLKHKMLDPDQKVDVQPFEESEHTFTVKRAN